MIWQHLKQWHAHTHTQHTIVYSGQGNDALELVGKPPRGWLFLKTKTESQMRPNINYFGCKHERAWPAVPELLPYSILTCWSTAGTGAQFRVSNNISVDQFDVVSGTQHSKLLTLTRTHLTARHGARAKYNQPFVAQSEVALTHPHSTLTLNLTIAI